MKEQIALLEELHEIDRKVKKLAEEMEAFPRGLENAEEELGEEEVVLIEIKEALANHEREKRDKDDELSIIATNLERFQERLKSIKTNAEYQASLKEIDQAKKQNVALEEEILALMEMIEEESKKLSEEETIFSEKRNKTEEEKKTISKKQREAEKILNKILKEREEKKKAIVPKVSEIYENLRSKINGDVLVRANEGTCTGCHMHIPPQLINDAIKMEKLYQCPHCLRILLVT